MKLNPNCNFADFLSTISLCSGEVFFETTQGDVLNLKSELCRYVFAVVVSQPHLLESGSLICKDSQDVDLLKEYLL